MCAPVAQLDRASASGVEGHEFESRRVYHFFALSLRKKIRAQREPAPGPTPSVFIALCRGKTAQQVFRL